MSSGSKATSGSSDQKKPRQDNTKNKGKVGDWVRHTSSSGKEYYYNVTTHASQWEKPREWLDYEQKHGPVPNVPAGSSSSSSRVQPGVKVQQHSSSTTGSSSSQSQQQHDRERDREHHQQLHQQQQREREAAQRDRYHQQHQHGYRPSSISGNSSNSVPPSSSAAPHSQQHASGSGVAVPSTSSNSTNAHSWNSSGAGSSHHAHSSTSYGAHTLTTAGTSLAAPSTSATSNHGSSRAHYSETRPSSSVSSLQQGLRDIRKPSEDMQSEDMDISPLDEDSGDQGVRPQPTTYGQAHQNQLNSLMSLPGPSTSTYGNRNLDRERDRERERERNSDRDDRDSYRNYHRDRVRGSGGDPREGARKERERGSDRNENRDRGGRRDQETPRDQQQRDKERERPGRTNNSREERSRSPLWDKDRTPERQVDATLSLGLSSLETAKEKEIPELPASLATFFREDLIAHVKNLPGEGLERQANKLMEDLLTVNSIQLSKVSSELKMARSLVRLTDIQATLQEQKILFLRQQIKDLEESDTSSGLGMEQVSG